MELYGCTTSSDNSSLIAVDKSVATEREECRKTMAESGQPEQVVTPWEAHAAEGQAAIDYGKLISKYLPLTWISESDTHTHAHREIR